MDSHERSTVILSSRAYLSIVAETFERIGTETGGILLGKRLGDVWYVVDAIDPGPDSVFRPAYFEYDTPYVNHLANKVARHYLVPPELLGLWHRHPGSMDTFSTTDDGTHREYLNQIGGGIISGLVNLDPTFRLTMYRVSRRLSHHRASVIVGDEHVPAHLVAQKKVEDFMPVGTESGGQDELASAAVVASGPHHAPKTEPRTWFKRVVTPFLKPAPDAVRSLTGSTSVHPPADPSRVTGESIVREAADVVGRQPDPREAVLDMVEQEMGYLESQVDYDFSVEMNDDEAVITMQYVRDMSYYPQQIECVLGLSAEGDPYAVITGEQRPYVAGVVRAHVNAAVEAAVRDAERTARRR